MKTLANISIWEMIEPLKWTAFKRLDLLFMDKDFDRFYKEGKRLTKKIEADLKIAREENREADEFIKEFAIKAEQDWIRNLPF